MRLNKFSIEHVQQAMKASAELDKQICDEEWLRCFEYHSDWDEGVAMARYNNGGGDYFIVLFCEKGAIIKGFDHESDVSRHAQEECVVWPGIYQDVPQYLLNLLNDEALEKDDVTFCYWRSQTDDNWNKGPVIFENNEDDGSDWLLGEIFLTPEEYIVWAKEYYEEDFNKISTTIVVKTYNAYNASNDSGSGSTTPDL